MNIAPNSQLLYNVYYASTQEACMLCPAELISLQSLFTVVKRLLNWSLVGGKYERYGKYDRLNDGHLASML